MNAAQNSQTRGRSSKRVRVTYVQNGRSQEVDVEIPATGVGEGENEGDQRMEARQFVQTLVDNGRLEGPGATHEIVTDSAGVSRLQRRGFKS